jgi:uncharacterized protein YgiM (DUF1202 family)
VLVLVALIGFIPSSAAASGTMRVTAGIGLNVRTGPGLGYKIITAMPYGTVVETGEQSGDWVKVQYNGVSGWSNTGWLTSTTATASSASSPSTNDSTVSYGSRCTWAWGGQVCAPAYIADAIYSAAARYGVGGDRLFNVAACESGFNPGAVGAAGEIGIFQFMRSTYYAYGSGDIWNVTNQANTAAYMFSIGLSYEWTCAR